MAAGAAAAGGAPAPPRLQLLARLSHSLALRPAPGEVVGPLAPLEPCACAARLTTTVELTLTSTHVVLAPAPAPAARERGSGSGALSPPTSSSPWPALPPPDAATAEALAELAASLLPAFGALPVTVELWTAMPLVRDAGDEEEGDVDNGSVGGNGSAHSGGPRRAAGEWRAVPMTLVAVEVPPPSPLPQRRAPPASPAASAAAAPAAAPALRSRHAHTTSAPPLLGGGGGGGNGGGGGGAPRGRQLGPAPAGAATARTRSSSRDSAKRVSFAEDV